MASLQLWLKSVAGLNRVSSEAPTKDRYRLFQLTNMIGVFIYLF